MGWLPPGLQRPLGAFVTLHVSGQLNGCIGHIIGTAPIAEGIAELAVSSAFHDPRLPALQSDDLAALDIEAMTLLLAHGADPEIPTSKPAERSRGGGTRGGNAAVALDPSGLPPVPVGGPAVYPIHAATGVGYGQGYAANAHRTVPDGWMPALRFLVEELGADVNARDHEGYTPLHHAAARGDTEMIEYLVEHGADVGAVSRYGQTTADMANGPYQRTQPYPEAVALLERLGSINNQRCVSCD